MLVWLCSAQFSCAFPIYTAEAQLELESSSSTPPGDTIPQDPAASDLHASRAVASPMDSVLNVAGTMLSSAPATEARHLLAATGASAFERPFAGSQFQSLTIAGLEYSTGLGLDGNDCSGKAAVGVCPSITEALFDLASAQAPGN
jgi:hypothetical protein